LSLLYYLISQATTSSLWPFAPVPFAGSRDAPAERAAPDTLRKHFFSSMRILFFGVPCGLKTVFYVNSPGIRILLLSNVVVLWYLYFPLSGIKAVFARYFHYSSASAAFSRLLPPLRR